MALRYPLVLNGTTIEELQSADSIDFTSASISGDLTFTGTGARVKANFSDPIATNRLLFQTSTANSTTLVGIMPSGTGTTSGIYGVNSSTLTNASYFDLRVSGSGSDVRLTSDYYGAGTYLPITFYTGGLEQVRITANSGGPANFQFSQSGTRVTGDFSNGTAANRVLFQTSTANSTTAVGIIPSGTGSTSIIYGTNNSDLTNASYFDLRASGSGNDVRLTSDYYGAGTYLPITFYTGGSERVRLDTSGNFSIAGLTAFRALATDASKNLVSSTVTSTELDYLSGVTSAIQTQLNSKAGTATANTFTNNQIISVSSASDALRITQTGAGNALVVEDSANPDATPFVIKGDGVVRRGTTATIGFQTALGASYNYPGIINAGTTGNDSSIINAAFSSSGTNFGSALCLARSGGATVGDYAVLPSGYAIGQVSFNSSDGTQFLEAAVISAYVDGTPGLNDMPGRLVFSTTADGASSPTEKMRIDNAGRVGIGANPSSYAETRFVLAGTLPSSGGYTISCNAVGLVPSTTTTEYAAFNTNVYVESTAFTLNRIKHYSAQQSSAFSGSSVVTNQYGFFAHPTLTGATNNFGFHSNIPSGTGRYNFYAAGTADNYFGGPVVVSTSSSSDALRITQTGSGNALLVEDAANPDATPFVVNADGRVGIGVGGSGILGDAGLQLQTESSSGPVYIYLRRAETSSGASGIRFDKLRGTGASPIIVNAGDTLGNMFFRGYDGTTPIQAAAITAAVDGTPGTNDMPGRLVFSTTADGASSPTERMRIDNAGNIYGTSGTTAMTNGFFYIPSAAGAPSGVPTAVSGRVPMYYDTTNNNFYVYNGAWKKVLLA